MKAHNRTSFVLDLLITQHNSIPTASVGQVIYIKEKNLGENEEESIFSEEIVYLEGATLH